MTLLLSDDALVAGCRSGQRAAQEQLYRRFAPAMLSLCRRYVRNAWDAEDVLARGFSQVFRGLPQFAGTGCLAGWVRRIMVREALGWLRRQHPNMLRLDDCSTGHLATDQPAADVTLQAADLLRLVQELPAGYRAVFNLCAIEGYSHPEAANLLGIAEGTSKSQLAKARALLQRRLAALQAASLSTSATVRYAA